MTDAPHFTYPFEVASSGVKVVEQDSIDEIATCVYAILATEEGTRQELPDFGLEDPTFALNGLSEEQLREVVEQWEPRAELLTEIEWSQLVQKVQVRVGV